MSAIVWDRSPVQLAESLKDWGSLLETRIGRMLASFALEAQAEMKLGRPWQDITGNARRGLRVFVVTQGVHQGKQWIIYFVHSVEYGVHLELGHGGRYAILVPTIELSLPKIRRRLQGIA
jgi:hypothetical protein